MMVIEKMITANTSGAPKVRANAATTGKIISATTVDRKPAVSEA